MNAVPKFGANYSFFLTGGGPVHRELAQQLIKMEFEKSGLKPYGEAEINGDGYSLYQLLSEENDDFFKRDTALEQAQLYGRHIDLQKTPEGTHQFNRILDSLRQAFVKEATGTDGFEDLN